MLERRSRLGKYEIMEELGIGAMATVYKAKNTESGAPVAIKIPDRRLLTSVRALRQFKREGEALIRLQHPNIVRVHSVGQQDELPYIVMDYVPGHTLAQEMQSRGQFSLGEAVEILLPLADALDYSHTEETFHCDVKPGNIRMYRGRIPLLVDFGIVQTAKGTLWDEGKPVGSVWYMSPEQARGERATGQSDQYALAVVTYEMLTGHVPFDGDNPYAIVLQQRDREPPLPGEWGERLREVMQQALDKDPEKRFASCTEFVRELKAAGRESESSFAERELKGKPGKEWREEEDAGWVEEPGMEAAVSRVAPMPNNSSRTNAAAAVAPARISEPSLESKFKLSANPRSPLLYAGLIIVPVFIILASAAIIGLARHNLQVRPKPPLPAASTSSPAPITAANAGIPAPQTAHPVNPMTLEPPSRPTPHVAMSPSEDPRVWANTPKANSPVVQVTPAPVINPTPSIAITPSEDPRLWADTPKNVNQAGARSSAVPKETPPPALPSGQLLNVERVQAPSPSPSPSPVSNMPVQTASNVPPPAIPSFAPGSTPVAPRVSYVPNPAIPEGTFVAARLKSKTTPAVTPIARHYLEAINNPLSSTEVIVVATVGPDGKVSNARIVKGPSVFQETVTTCLKQWRYEPARRGNQPVESEVTVNFAFKNSQENK